MLISSQRFLDDEVVQSKRDAKDYTVTVSPEFEIDDTAYRVIIDGHHSLAAAVADGADPTYIECDDDRIALLDTSIDDYLEANWVDDDWYDINTGRIALFMGRDYAVRTSCNCPTGEWRHPDDCPPPRGKTILILSRYGVAVSGKWDDRDAAWMPLPKVEAGLKKRLQDEGEIEMIDHKKRVTIKAIRPYGGEATKDLLDFSARLFGWGLAASLCAGWAYGLILIVSVVFGD